MGLTFNCKKMSGTEWALYEFQSPDNLTELDEVVEVVQWCEATFDKLEWAYQINRDSKLMVNPDATISEDRVYYQLTFMIDEGSAALFKLRWLTP